MNQAREVARSADREMDAVIAEAARQAGYEAGFGLQGCDLSKSGFWAAYTRQSMEEQRNNNRLPEYLPVPRKRRAWASWSLGSTFCMIQ